MRIAIIGSRDYPHLRDVSAFVAGLAPGTTVVSGGAPGVDRMAVAAARYRGLGVEEYRPDYARLGRRAPLVRNATIVERVERLVAFWDLRSNGIAYTLLLARAKGIPITVFGAKAEAVEEAEWKEALG